MKFGGTLPLDIERLFPTTREICGKERLLPFYTKRM